MGRHGQSFADVRVKTKSRHCSRPSPPDKLAAGRGGSGSQPCQLLSRRRALPNLRQRSERVVPTTPAKQLAGPREWRGTFRTLSSSMRAILIFFRPTARGSHRQALALARARKTCEKFFGLLPQIPKPGPPLPARVLHGVVLCVFHTIHEFEAVMGSSYLLMSTAGALLSPSCEIRFPGASFGDVCVCVW